MNTTIQGASVSDVTSKVTEATVAELTVYAISSVVELFVQEFVVLQITLFSPRARDVAGRSIKAMRVRCLSF